jgi:hypothetical protein
MTASMKASKHLGVQPVWTARNRHRICIVWACALVTIDKLSAHNYYELHCAPKNCGLERRTEHERDLVSDERFASE